jgi:hypothetical protein
VERRAGDWCEMATSLELVKWNNSAVEGYSPDSTDVSTAVEESSVLLSVTGKRLLKVE